MSFHAKVHTRKIENDRFLVSFITSGDFDRSRARTLNSEQRSYINNEYLWM